MKDNKILFCLFLSNLVMMAFYLVPDGPERDYFPLADQLISLQAHVYYMQEHVSRALIILALLLAMPEHKRIMWIFFAMEIVTLVDYVVRYNRDILVPGFDINTIKLVVYGTLIFSSMKGNNQRLYGGAT